jgi:hypothetical protein
MLSDVSAMPEPAEGRLQMKDVLDSMTICAAYDPGQDESPDPDGDFPLDPEPKPEPSTPCPNPS